jgi:hypothetical protein
MLELELYYDKLKGNDPNQQLDVIQLDLEYTDQYQIETIIRQNKPLDWFITYDGRHDTKDFNDILEIFND